MHSVLRGHANFSKKACSMHKDGVMKMFTNLQAYADFSRKLPSTRNSSFSTTDYYHSVLRMLPNVLDHHAFSKRRYINTDSTLNIFGNFREHADFSKQLVYTDKDLTEYIGDLVADWVMRFDTLGAIDAYTISGALNAFSKLDIYDGIWRREDQENIKSLIIRLTEEGNKLLDTKTEGNYKFTVWQIANTLNALSKWNVLNNNIWGNDKVHVFKSFIIRLINQGNWLSAEKFNSLAITNILNALSKWHVDEFPGARQLIVQLMKHGNKIVEEGSGKPTSFTSLSIVRCLNAICKWNINDLQGGKEFIANLMRQGTSMCHEFNSQEISNSLNAVSKWNIQEIREAKIFIIRLMKRGDFITDRFSCQAISNCLNALSKWNIAELEGAEHFITEMVKRGNTTAKGFNSQEIANSLNAISKWNIYEIQGVREFIVELVKCGNLTAHTFNSQGISSTLNALSKWNADELEGTQELIELLIQRGNSTIDGFNSQSIATTLNALSKWKIDEIPGAREFIVRLLKRSSLMVDGFDSLAVANSLNALSKWNVDEFEGAREFIINLLKRGSSLVESFNSQNIAISLNALAKWNINELPGTREFIVLLAIRGSFINDKFNSVGIASSLNALHRFCVFNDEKWNDGQLKIVKDFIIKIVEKGLQIYGKFDALNVALAFNAFSTLYIFNNETWTNAEQRKLMHFIVSLSKLNAPYKKFTLESVSKTYVTLCDWNIFHRNGLESSQLQSFENLVKNLESRIIFISQQQYVENPDDQLTYGAQIIKDLPKIKSKLLIVSETQVLVSLMICLSNGVDKSTASRLRGSVTQQNILSGLKGLRESVADLRNRSSLEGVFDESLFKIRKKFVGLNLIHVDEVLDLINEFDKLGIIESEELCKFQPSIN